MRFGVICLICWSGVVWGDEPPAVPPAPMTEYEPEGEDADNAAAPAPAPAVEAQPAATAVASGGYVESSVVCCTHKCRDKCCEQWVKRTRKEAFWGRSTYDMYPWTAYHPVNHGYYYFRPYNYSAIERQGGVAMGWGGTRENPYVSGPNFEEVYKRHTKVTPTLDTEPMPMSDRKNQPSNQFNGVE